jgi:hypothetical protein
MSAPKRLTPAVHDTIDTLASAAEEIHKAAADLPLELLGRLTSLETTLAGIRDGQARSISAVYDLVRTVNARARKVTSAVLTG